MGAGLFFNVEDKRGDIWPITDSQTMGQSILPRYIKKTSKMQDGS